MNRKSSRLVVLTISTGFLFLYFIFSFHWAIIVAAMIGSFGILSSFISYKIEWFWLKLAQFLSLIFSNILLTAVYYFILFPISLVSRFFSKDPLMLSRKYKSYFVDREKKLRKEDFEKTW